MTTTEGKTTTTKPPAQAPAASLSSKGMFYMCLLAVQFGIQPILTRTYTAKEICRSTVILVQEIMKFFFALLMLYASSGSSGKDGDPENDFASVLKSFSFQKWISVAVLPAALYSIQNLAALLAYQNLDALTFNVLNQTKTLSAALCCYLVIGRKQSTIQIFALLLLLLAALVMEKIVSINWMFLGQQQQQQQEQASVPLGEEESDGESSSWDAKHFTHGVAPILLASFISGLAGALVQKTLQVTGGSSGKGANPYLTSMELCAASAIFLLGSLLVSSDGKQISELGFWHGWDLPTLIPIATNSIGGIIVGLVTKYAGSVRKGFALIFGILLSGILQQLLALYNQPGVSDDDSAATTTTTSAISKEQIVGGVMAALSLYLHATNPPAPAQPKHVKQD